MLPQGHRRSRLVMKALDTSDSIQYLLKWFTACCYRMLKVVTTTILKIAGEYCSCDISSRESRLGCIDRTLRSLVVTGCYLRDVAEQGEKSKVDDNITVMRS